MGKAQDFATLHVKGAPVELYNCWDAGSAAAIAAGGAPAIATGSWGVAAALGYGDGQDLPMAELLALVARIVVANDLPVTVDFEGAYGDSPAEVAANAKALAATGAVGMNFEDRYVGGTGIWPVAEQAGRIAAIRDAVGPDFFINARTDLFLQSGAGAHAGVIDEAIARGQAYEAAGASGFFVPKLGDGALITQVCADVPLPVNVMMHDGLAALDVLQAAGVARISYGPSSYVAAMQEVTRVTKAIYAPR
ncbi:isocitrate lyase/PEP mutase family protein [Sulfitobacter sp.]|uniref:isocitrate lyase/PEP mutase family protein n=1 Tax=Sulfitobacter sp. TaxID=1903071 RepID=UPI003EFA1FFB